MSTTPKIHPYNDKDLVEVEDAEGNVLPDRVPKSWLGTDLLPEGVKKKSGRSTSSSSSSSASTADPSTTTVTGD